jgi:rare lipoprotein A
VRVNDRGPYVGNRVIDVSRNVAELLDFKRDGVARVKVDYVGPARMDGLDKQMLLASYRGPGPSQSPYKSPFGDFAVASAAPVPAPPRVRPATYPTATASLPGPMALTPSYATPAALTSDDPLAPLILRNSGFARSYAATAALSPAHLAAAELAAGGSLAALDRAAAAKARLTAAHAAPPAVIQLGLFSDPKNVAAITARFQALGTVQTVAANLAGKPVTTIRVVTDGRADASAVLAAAGAAGLKDAYIAR